MQQKQINMRKQGASKTKCISCDWKCNFNSTTSNSNQKCNNKTFQYESKNICFRKTDYLSTCLCKNGKCLKSIVDTSVIACVEIRHNIDIVSTKIANALATIAKSAVLTSCHKKTQDIK